MNPETRDDILLKLSSMSETINEMKSSLVSMKINEQLYLKSNGKIQPGIASKLSYDANGLIVKGEQLQQSDIPSLPVNKIIGLQQILDEKVTMDEINKRINELKSGMNELSKAVYTGIKVNYNENGQIVSSSGLIQDDIPSLPLEKIIGLRERLELLETYHPTSDVKTDESKPSSSNNQPSKSVLSMDDIPGELMVRINTIEGALVSLVSQTSFNAMNKIVEDKLDANPSPITSGIFTKVKVDSKGLVTDGSLITINDLPELTISNITNLREILAKKVDQSEFMALNDTVSSLVNSMSRIGEVANMRINLETKAEDADLQVLKTRVDKIEKLFSEVISKIPSELILQQVEGISSEISTISGRLSVLESRLGLTP